jgi:2-desacetyl-2-hydroxyethyl bacteriochlorophyllide A dehydrogenase
MSPSSTQAVVFTEPRSVQLQTVSLPTMGDRDLHVRTLYSGISTGTELWTLTNRYWSTKFPVVPGYQKVGRVEAVGSGVEAYAPGDLVFIPFSRIEDEVNLEWGGHTAGSIVEADQEWVFKLPEGIDPVAASQLVVAATPMHGLTDVMPIAAGERVAIIGQGAIGLNAAQIAASAGAEVYVLDLIDTRMQLAERLCGARPVRADDEGNVPEFRDRPLDAVVDTSAHAPTINRSFHWLRHGGRYCFQGYYPGETSLDLLQPHVSELVMYHPTSVTAENLHRAAAECVSGRLQIRPLISQVVPAREAPEAYARLMQRDPETLSVVLDWTEGDR